MSHDVFISHTHQDKPIADAVCSALESAGIRCWIAPRDIQPGSEWGESIVNAIAGCSIMVVVFSANANASKQVLREVERCVNKGNVLVPLRVEDVAPSGSMEYFLGTPHWLDALTPPMEAHIARLVDTVQRVLKRPADTAARPPQPPSPPAEPTPDDEISLIRSRMLRTTSLGDLRQDLYRVEALRERHPYHAGLRELHDQLSHAVQFATPAQPTPRVAASVGTPKAMSSAPRWGLRLAGAGGAVVTAALLFMLIPDRTAPPLTSPAIDRADSAPVVRPSGQVVSNSSPPVRPSTKAESPPPRVSTPSTRADSAPPRVSTPSASQAPPVMRAPMEPPNPFKIYLENELDEQVAPLPSNPPPAYPASLRAANIEGEVLLQFVVDDTGRVMSASVKVVKSTHRLFTEAAMTTLPQLRFRPGMRAGVPVLALVQMPFQFSLTKTP